MSRAPSLNNDWEIVIVQEKGPVYEIDFFNLKNDTRTFIPLNLT